MLEIFRDSAWGFVGVFLAVLALILSILFFYFQKTKKSLVYNITRKTKLISPTADLKKNLEIFYDSLPVGNISLISIKIVNSGNVAITKTDYERDIFIIFEGSYFILSYEAKNFNPKNLHVEINIEDNTLMIPPVLLNSKDFFEIDVLYSGEIKSVDVNGRISGISEITQFNSRRGFTHNLYVLFIVSSSIGFFIAAIYEEVGSLAKVLYFVFSLINLIWLFVSLWVDNWLDKKIDKLLDKF